MKVTFLGTGTSQGVPVIGCGCDVCRSTDSRDKRLRTSAMVEYRGRRIIIDAGPDFRYQMLRTGVTHIDAILLTHEHKDHTGGIDDVRPFNFVDYPVVHRVDIYATHRTAECVRKDFDYAFVADKYRGVPEIDLHEFDAGRPFEAAGITIIPIPGLHSARFDVTGYRIGNFAYLTDFSYIAPEQVELLDGVDTLVVNALRWHHRGKPEPSHFIVDEALQLIAQVAPRKAYLTHMSHEIGLHAEASKRLNAGVEFAFDTLQIEVNE